MLGLAIKTSFGILLAAVVLAAACGPPAAGPQARGHLYWTDNPTNSVGRANLDGSDVDGVLVGGIDSPAQVAVDGRYVYWTNDADDTIGRANLDGSGADERFIAVDGMPGGIAVDAQHVYWTNVDAGAIGRAALDGSGAQQRIVTGADRPEGIAVDGGHLYWANSGGGAIGRAGLDGSGADQRFTRVHGNPVRVAVDAQHVYWTNVGAGAIGRAALDGSGFDERFISGLNGPVGLAVDAHHVYWTNDDGDGSAIGRANLDGSAVDRRFIAGLRNSGGLAISRTRDPAPEARKGTRHTAGVTVHPGTAQVAEPAELLADVTDSVDVIVGVPQATTDGPGNALVWRQAQTARDAPAGAASTEVPDGSIGAALDNAIGYSCWHVARLLVARGARVDKLWHAGTLGMLERVEELLEIAEPTPEEVSQAFWHACSGGQRRAAERLLAAGADLNWEPEYAHGTALDAAHGRGTRQENMIGWLKEKGVRPADPDSG